MHHDSFKLNHHKNETKGLFQVQVFFLFFFTYSPYVESMLEPI